MAAIHAAVLIVVISSKEPIPSVPEANDACPPEALCFGPGQGAGEMLVARRVFHLRYETTTAKFLMLTDLPAMLAAGIVLGLPSWVAGVSPDAGSYHAAFGWIGLGSLQWWMSGTYLYIETRSARVRK